MLLRIEIDHETYLKQLELEDAENLFQSIDRDRDYLRTWLPFVDHTTKLVHTRHFVQNVIRSGSGLREIILVIHHQEKFAGIIGFKGTDPMNRKTEIGYWLARDFQGKGIMYRSCAALLDYAFTRREMNRITIKCAVGNTKSSRIPEKLGFRLEGIERDGELLNQGYTDVKVYSILKKEWHSQSAVYEKEEQL
ncbi:MAG: GNAT family N-acetyltransferase [Candidatus Cyclobacteriaceae bacterium M3_2C_046]